MQSISFAFLQSILKGEWVGDLPQPLEAIAEIEEATAKALVYAVSPKYVEKIKHSACGFAIVPKGQWELPCPYVMVDNPYLAFAQVLQALHPVLPQTSGVHPLAFVHETARLGSDVHLSPGVFVGAGVVVGSRTILNPNVVLEKGVRVGSDCLLHSNSVVREGCILGDRVILQAGCVIGSDGYGFVFDAGQHKKIPQTGIVELGDDVEVGACTTIDRATFASTRIGRGTKIDNLVQIGHNCIVGDHCLFAAQSGVSGSTAVGNYVTFAGQSGSVGHIEIGQGSVIMARGVATSSLPPKSRILGFPGQDHKKFLRQEASLRRFEEIREKVLRIWKFLNMD